MVYVITIQVEAENFFWGANNTLLLRAGKWASWSPSSFIHNPAMICRRFYWLTKNESLISNGEKLLA